MTSQTLTEYTAKEALYDSQSNKNTLSDKDIKLANHITNAIKNKSAMGETEFNFQAQDFTNYADVGNMSFNSKLNNHFHNLGYKVEISNHRNEEYIKISW